MVQDVAHSYGARWNELLVTKYGDAAIFGCNISKLLNSVFGGMVITNDAKTADLLRKFRIDNCKKQGFSKSIKRFIYFFAVNITFNTYVYGIVNILERKGFLD